MDVRVLIIGHACSPRFGSEPGFTWNWAWHLSRFHHVWVIAHPHDREAVEEFLKAHPNRRLRFYWLDVPEALNPWKPQGPDRGLRFHYMLWLRLAYQRACTLHHRIGFQVVHHISYGSVSAPPPVRLLHIPHIWGPIGGGQKSPVSFRRYFGSAWAHEMMRNARLRLLRYSPGLRSAVRSSSVILATNRETLDLLQAADARDVRLCLDSGISPEFASHGQILRSSNDTLTLLWVGRMQRRKALPLALEALAEVRNLNVRLLIAGDGEMRLSWERCAERLCIRGKVEFLGNLPWREMPALYRRSDALLFTSLRDSFGTQVLEAMAHGLPVLALDHQGVGTFVPGNAGIKVPVTNPGETLSAICDGIRWLVQNPSMRGEQGQAGRAYALTQTWERRAEWMSKLYEEVSRTRVSARLGGPAPYGSYGVTKRMAKIDETLDLRGKQVLDIGCGNGSYTVDLAKRGGFVCGLDVQLPNLRSFRGPLPRIQAAAEELPFPTASFDVVTMIEVLEHTRDDRQVLRECFRVLKPGGALALFVPNRRYPLESHPCHLGAWSLGRNIPLVSWLPHSWRKHLCDARIYSRHKLISMARAAGFKVSERGWGYIFPPLDSFPLPFKRHYRKASSRLEETALRVFGVSIYAVFAKPDSLGCRGEEAALRSAMSEPHFDALGVRVDVLQMDDVIKRIERWIAEGTRCRTVAATGMHGVVEAHRDPVFRRILHATDLVVADGMPLVWIGRHLGHVLPGRVYGPDLLLAFCEATRGKRYRHFFYGGEAGVPEKLAEQLGRRFPGINIAGTFSPPFRPLNSAEEQDVATRLNHAAPDIVWVGLGTPKQERWMQQHKACLTVPVMVSVGAAFDLLSGRRSQAPPWMQDHGLEWLYRLCQEPSRLWRRYLACAAQFLVYLARERIGLRSLGTSRDTHDSTI